MLSSEEVFKFFSHLVLYNRLCFDPVSGVDLVVEVAKCRAMQLNDTASVFIIKILGEDEERVKIIWNVNQ